MQRPQYSAEVVDRMVHFRFQGEQTSVPGGWGRGWTMRKLTEKGVRLITLHAGHENENHQEKRG